MSSVFDDVFGRKIENTNGTKCLDFKLLEWIMKDLIESCLTCFLLRDNLPYREVSKDNWPQQYVWWIGL